MIRTAREQDTTIIAQIEADCFGRGSWSRALIEGELGNDVATVLVVAHEGVVTGYASIRVAGEIADLQRIAVLPEARRAGLGRQLVEELLARAAAYGASRVLLEVAATNSAAIGLYESFGFAEISRRRRYYADGIDALVLERSLD